MNRRTHTFGPNLVALALLVGLGAPACQLVTNLDESRLQNYADGAVTPEPDAQASDSSAADVSIPEPAHDAAVVDGSAADAMQTPDAAVPTPDAAVPTPDAAVPTPDAMVPTPDAMVPPACSQDCSELDSLCERGVCDKKSGKCITKPLPKGSACDAKFCKVAEICDGDGKCGGGDDLQCTGGAACEVRECDESERACVVEERGCAIDGMCIDEGKKNPANSCEVCAPDRNAAGWTTQADGASCNDHLKCTNADMCQAGVCVGQDRCDEDKYCSPERKRCVDRDDD